MSSFPNTDDEAGMSVTVLGETGFERLVEYPDGTQAPEYYVEGEEGEEGQWVFLYDECGYRLYEERESE